MNPRTPEHEALRLLAIRLFDALEHVHGCAKCCEAGMDECPDGGQDADRALREARTTPLLDPA